MEPINVVTWNVEMNRWDAAKEEAAERTFALLRSMESPLDFVCLQGVEKVEPFANWLGNRYQAVKTGVKTAIFFNRQRFDSLDGGEIPLLGDFTAIKLADKKSPKHLNVVSAMLGNKEVCVGGAAAKNVDAWNYLFQIRHMSADITLVAYSADVGAQFKPIIGTFTGDEYVTDRTHITPTYLPDLSESDGESPEFVNCGSFPKGILRNREGDKSHSEKHARIVGPISEFSHEEARRFDGIFIKGAPLAIKGKLKNLNKVLPESCHRQVSCHVPVIGRFILEEVAKNVNDSQETRPSWPKTIIEILTPPGAGDGSSYSMTPAASTCEIM